MSLNVNGSFIFIDTLTKTAQWAKCLILADCFLLFYFGQESLLICHYTNCFFIYLTILSTQRAPYLHKGMSQQASGKIWMFNIFFI